MMNPIYVGSAVAIAAAVALAIVHPTPSQQQPAKEITVVLEEPVAPKEDIDPVVHTVHTMTFSTVDVPVIAPVITPPLSDEGSPETPVRVSQEPRPKPTGDICARHGGHRVDDPGRRSWHCAYPKRT